MTKYIVHMDMDAFFAAIEQRDDPKLRGIPVIIGADPKAGFGRGVVSTCSYEARKFGIHSAMPISIAYNRCPKAAFLPCDMEKYHQVSEQIYEILYGFTPKIEVVSVDEAFLDITGSFHLFKTPLNTCIELKKRIKAQTSLVASCGLAPTKMAAKIASDLEKPDGLVQVKQDELLEFLWPLDIGKIWGLGAKTKESLNSMGIRTIRDLAKTDIRILEESFGKHGEYFWALANGIDQREIEPQEEAKSVSNEHTFNKDTNDKDLIKRVFMRLCEKVSIRLREDNIKGKTITLKIRLEGFNTYTRAITIVSATNFVDTIYKAVMKLFDGFDRKGKKVRLLGVKVSNLISQDTRDSIFAEANSSKLEGLHKAVDKIKGKFGRGSILRGLSIDN